jgi:hypothetical protein
VAPAATAAAAAATTFNGGHFGNLGGLSNNGAARDFRHGSSRGGRLSSRCSAARNCLWRFDFTAAHAAAAVAARPRAREGIFHVTKEAVAVVTTTSPGNF